MTQAEIIRAVSDLRRDIAMVIAQNPVSIAISREEKVPDGAGGYRTVRRTLPAFLGRLARRRERPVDAQEPVSRRTYPWVLLAPYDADLRAGPHPTDRFEAMGRRFVVRDVRPMTLIGTHVYGYEAECEEEA